MRRALILLLVLVQASCHNGEPSTISWSKFAVEYVDSRNVSYQFYQADSMLPRKVRVDATGVRFMPYHKTDSLQQVMTVDRTRSFAISSLSLQAYGWWPIPTVCEPDNLVNYARQDYCRLPLSDKGAWFWGLDLNPGVQLSNVLSGFDLTSWDSHLRLDKVAFQDVADDLAQSPTFMEITVDADASGLDLRCDVAHADGSVALLLFRPGHPPSCAFNSIEPSL